MLGDALFKFFYLIRISAEVSFVDLVPDGDPLMISLREHEKL